MKNKLLTFMGSFVLGVSAMFGLAACDKHEHKFDSNWTTNATHHWHKCNSCEEVKDEETHNWDNGKVITEATKTANGEKLFTCEDCEKTKIENYSYNLVTTVTETEWKVALSIISYQKFESTKSYGTTTSTLIKDGDVLKQIMYYGENSDNIYMSKEDGKYYSYTYNLNNWKKTEINDETYDTVLSGLDLSSYATFGSFTYNKAIKAYEGAVLASLENPKLYFENKKLVKLTGLLDSTTITYTFKYDNINLTLPSAVPHVPVTTVNQLQWQGAFVLYDYNEIKLTQEYDGDKIEVVLDDDFYQETKYQNNEIVSQVYFSKESNKYYEYSLNVTNNTWVKTEIAKEKYNSIFAGLDLGGTSEYNNFTYNTETKAYEGDVLGSLEDVKIYFEDGKLVKMVGVISDKIINYTVEYFNIEIVLPEV